MKLYTDADLADMLGITVPDVRTNVRTKGWPCVRPKRSVWRFTEEQVAAIVAMHSVRRSPVTVAADDMRPTSRSQRRAS